MLKTEAWKERAKIFKNWRRRSPLIAMKDSDSVSKTEARERERTTRGEKGNLIVSFFSRTRQPGDPLLSLSRGNLSLWSKQRDHPPLRCSHQNLPNTKRGRGKPPVKKNVPPIVSSSARPISQSRVRGLCTPSRTSLARSFRAFRSTRWSWTRTPWSS